MAYAGMLRYGGLRNYEFGHNHMSPFDYYGGGGCSSCVINPYNQRHECQCYDGDTYITGGRVLQATCECPACPLLDQYVYPGGYYPAAYGR